MSLVSECRDPRRLIAVGSTMFTLALVALLGMTARAQAEELIFWSNHSVGPDSIGFSGIDGSAGGTLYFGGAKLEDPEGIAYDPVTNRIYVASTGTGINGQILYAKLDRSGGGVFSTIGVTVENPVGVTIDPVTRMIYWVNGDGPGEAGGSIAGANLDTGAGGLVNTAGAPVKDPNRITLDTVAGRVYWANENPDPESIGFANVNGTGGGTLATAGASPPEGITGLGVDEAGQRLYWIDADGVSSASLAAGAAGNVDITGSVHNGPFGLAVDPLLSRVYWGNRGNGEERAGAIGLARFSGGGGTVNPLMATVNGPQDPLIIKSPSGTEVPTVTRSKEDPAALSCSTGKWGADFPGGLVYRSPRAFAYRWSRDGKAIGGATASTFTAQTGGSYSCTVTATNQIGSASQDSGGAIDVKAARVKLTTRKKVNAEPGDLVTFKVRALNQGDVRLGRAAVCVKLPKASKANLKAPRCKSLSRLEAHGRRTVTLRVEVKPGADEGIDRLGFRVFGSAGKAAKSRIIVG